MAKTETRIGVKAITDFWDRHRMVDRTDPNRLYIVFDGWFYENMPAVAVTYLGSDSVRLWALDFDNDKLVELDPQDYTKHFNGEVLEKINYKGKRCQMCKGTGKVLAGLQPCPICKGRGVIDSSSNTAVEKVSKPEDSHVATTFPNKTRTTGGRESLLFDSSR